MQSQVIGSLSKIQDLMTQKLQNTNKKFNILKDSETDTVLEIMNKEQPSKTRGQSRFGMANQLAEPSTTL